MGYPLKKILVSLPPGPRPPIFIGVAEQLQGTLRKKIMGFGQCFKGNHAKSVLRLINWPSKFPYGQSRDTRP